MKIIKSKLFKTLFFIFLFGIVCGIISYIFMNKDAVNNNIVNYVKLIGSNDYNYFNGFIMNIYNDFKFYSLIWIFVIIFICSIFIPILIIFKGISIGFSISTIIYTFKIKGILYSVILMLPNILKCIIFILLSYYSISFSYKCYNAFKEDNSINIKKFILNYFYIYLILLFILIIICLIETYICFNILKFVV